MHFALINWITASLPSHANLLGRLPVSLSLYLFVTLFLFHLLFSLKFFSFTLLSFVVPHLVHFLFLSHTYPFFPFNHYSFRFTRICYYFLHALFTFSSRIIYTVL